jgi:hypothetical protein
MNGVNRPYPMLHLHSTSHVTVSSATRIGFYSDTASIIRSRFLL